jgi:hypothetical protein
MVRAGTTIEVIYRPARGQVKNAESALSLKAFRAKWIPVRAKKPVKAKPRAFSAPIPPEPKRL